MTKARDIADFKFENIVDTGTEGTKVASGTTAQRGSTAGQIRFNSTTGLAEYYNGSSFTKLEGTPVVTSVSPNNIDSDSNPLPQNITITGNNFQDGKWRGDASYYFSKYIHCWGWATWRRSWHKYDGNIKFWPKWSNSKDWVNFISNKIERRYWQNIFKRVHLEQVDSWAYPWTASIWYNKGLTITPNVNLVSNIGFGESATHTKSKKDKSFKMSVNNLGTLIYSNKVERNIEADNWTFNHHYGGKNLNFPFSLISYFRKIMIYLFENKK